MNPIIENPIKSISAESEKSTTMNTIIKKYKPRNPIIIIS
jgi:hypothetical protein